MPRRSQRPTTNPYRSLPPPPPPSSSHVPSTPATLRPNTPQIQPTPSTLRTPRAYLPFDKNPPAATVPLQPSMQTPQQGPVAEVVPSPPSPPSTPPSTPRDDPSSSTSTTYTTSSEDSIDEAANLSYTLPSSPSAYDETEEAYSDEEDEYDLVIQMDDEGIAGWGEGAVELLRLITSRKTIVRLWQDAVQMTTLDSEAKDLTERLVKLKPQEVESSDPK